MEEAAIELGMKKTAADLVAEETIPAPETRKYTTSDRELGSAVDMLIEAMKLRRASAVRNIPAVQTTQEKVVGSKTRNEFSGDPVMESGVDVLIEAMKLRRASVMERFFH